MYFHPRSPTVPRTQSLRVSSAVVVSWPKQEASAARADLQFPARRQDSPGDNAQAVAQRSASRQSQLLGGRKLPGYREEVPDLFVCTGKPRPLVFDVEAAAFEAAIITRPPSVHAVVHQLLDNKQRDSVARHSRFLA